MSPDKAFEWQSNSDLVASTKLSSTSTLFHQACKLTEAPPFAHSISSRTTRIITITCIITNTTSSRGCAVSLCRLASETLHRPRTRHHHCRAKHYIALSPSRYRRSKKAKAWPLSRLAWRVLFPTPRPRSDSTEVSRRGQAHIPFKLLHFIWYRYCIANQVGLTPLVGQHTSSAQKSRSHRTHVDTPIRHSSFAL